MYDFGLFTVPLLAGTGVFILALLAGQDIAVDRINVPDNLVARGYDEVVITRQLSDYMREINHGASSELTSVDLDHGNLEQSIVAFERFFDIQLLVTGTRNLLGLIPVFINGEVTEAGDDIVITIRVYNRDNDVPMHRAVVRGDPDEMDTLLRQVALETLGGINPYVVALYHRRLEQAAGDWEFPETHKAATHFLEERPLEHHFLIYGLLGRMHMLRAERAPDLTDEEREREYERAVDLLHGALLQRPDFLFPHINLAVIQATHGEFEAADASFRRAAEIDPRYRVTRELWGRMLLEQGRTEEALAQFVAAVEIDKRNPALRNQLGRLYLEVGRPDLARTQFEHAVRLNPREPEYLRNWRSLAVAAQ
jgi:tetratricopeptide (TPR) repeat protein